MFRRDRTTEYGPEECPALFWAPGGRTFRIGHGYFGPGWVDRFVQDLLTVLARLTPNYLPPEAVFPMLLPGEEVRVVANAPRLEWARPDFCVTSHGRFFSVRSEKARLVANDIKSTYQHGETPRPMVGVPVNPYRPRKQTTNRRPDGQSVQMRVDVVVACTFMASTIPPEIRGDTVPPLRFNRWIKHVDGDEYNNRVSNLEWWSPDWPP